MVLDQAENRSFRILRTALPRFLGSCERGPHEIFRPSSLLGCLPDGVALEMLDGTDARFSSFASFCEALHYLEIVEDPTISHPSTSNREDLVQVGSSRNVKLRTAKGHRNRG